METMNTMKESPSEIILDVSALTTEEGYDIVRKASKVYLTPGIINEMVGCKSARKRTNDFGWRVRDILRESAKDYEGQKYVCVFVEPKEVYEKDIFALKNQGIDAVIVTSNYGVCNHAKVHGMPYMLITVSEPMGYNENKHDDEDDELSEEILDEIVEEAFEDLEIPEKGRKVVAENGYYVPLPTSDYMITDFRGKEQKRFGNKLNQADFVTEEMNGTIYCYRIYQEGVSFRSKLLMATEDKKQFALSQDLPRKLAEAIEARF